MDNLTIFSITNGRSTHAHSLQSIQESARDVPVIIIRDKPWMEALRLCVDTCPTPYFLRVDDDMVLHPHSVKYISHVLPQVKRFGIIYWMLWETFTQRVRESIKVYSVNALQAIGGFHADPATGKVDRTTNPMMERLGWPVIQDTSILALHICGSWEEQQAYERLWGHEKPQRRSMQACDLSLEDQTNLRGGFLSRLNQDRGTRFAAFEKSLESL